MKFKPTFSLIAGVLPLLGALMVLTASPGTAQAQTGPDLKVTKVCVNGPMQSVLCTVTVTNLGTVPSVSPLSLTDVVTGAPADALFTGAGGTLPISCSPGAGPVSPIACSANTSLPPNQPKTALFSFKLPTGGSFTNCATVSQGQNAATLPDPNPANNTNICTAITVPPPSGSGGPITIVTPPPSGACASQTVVSGLHYPTQSCSQSTPGFLAGMMTSFHFKSKCTAPNTLLGVTNVSCQNAPIPGFPTGSVYQGTACCGIVPPLLGSITIQKDAQPNDAQDFTFTPSVVTIPAFQLDDDPTNNTLLNSKTITNLSAGSYTFTEGLVSGWNLASIVCTPSSGTTTNISTRAATINLAAGANVTCKFTNVKLPPTGTGTLTIVKVVQPAGNLQAFTFTSNVPGSIPTFQLDNNPGTGTIPNSKTFTNLPAGVPYTVTENAVTGWTTPSLQCLVAVPGSTTTFTDQLNRTFTVNLAAGANVTCTFINLKTP